MLKKRLHGRRTEGGAAQQGEELMQLAQAGASSLPLYDIGPDLPALPPPDYTVQAKNETEGNEFLFFDLKKLFAAQGVNTPVAEQISIASYANLFVLTGAGEVLLIDSSLTAPGSDIRFLVAAQGVRFRHMFDKNTIPVGERPANFAQLIPLYNSTRDHYTTINVNEPFVYTHVILPDDSRVFLDIFRTTQVGTVEQDLFVATLAEGSGLTVGVGFEILGFENGETESIQKIYGSAAWAPNAAKNGIICTAPGFFSGLKTTFDNISTLNITAADLADGTAFCFSTSGRMYPVGGGTAEVGATSDLADFFVHTYGYVALPGGALVIHSAAKVAQIYI